MSHNFCKRAVIRPDSSVHRKVRRFCTLRPKWHQTNGAVDPEMVYDCNPQGQGIITIKPQHSKLIGHRSIPYDAPGETSRQANAVERKAIKRILHMAVVHGDIEELDPAPTLDSTAYSEANWRGT